MRKLFYLAILVIVASCGSKTTNEVTVSGVITNLFFDDVAVYYPKNQVSREMVENKAKLDENNNFSMTFEISEPKYGQIRIGTSQFPLYLIPGADIKISHDAMDYESTPVITGKKSEETNFIHSFMKENQEKYGRAFIFETFSQDPEEFMASMEAAHQDKLSFLKKFKNYRKLDKSFRKMMENDFLFDKKLSIVNYPMYYSFLNQGEEPVLPSGFFNFLDDKKLFNDKYLSSPAYLAFVNSFLEKKVMDFAELDGEVLDHDSFLTKQFNLSQEVLSGKTLELILSKLMEGIFNFGSQDLIIDKYARFSELVKTEEYREEIDAMYRATIALAPGQPAPGFTLSDIDGNEVSLSDFLGKVVYLDFWASWCGPCLQQIPSARELKKRMEGTEVVFLYVSLDEDEEAWRAKVAEEKIEGVHVNVPGFSQEVPKLYNVSGVPTFYIIGRDGMIFDNRAPRPSQPEIDRVLLAALEEELV